jgi:hypothetical protein
MNKDLKANDLIINKESNKLDTQLLSRKASDDMNNISINNCHDVTNAVFDIKDEIKNNNQITSNKKFKLVVDHNSAQVESFLISDKPYQQLSDHFGLSVDMKFKDTITNEV